MPKVVRLSIRVMLCTWFLACGCTNSPDTPPQAHFRAAHITVTSLSPPTLKIQDWSKERMPAPLDRELEELPQARAFWIGPQGQRTYVVDLKAASDHAPPPPKPPLVLIHGMGAAGLRDFYPVMPELSGSRRVIALDLPGLGRSELGDEEPTPLVFASRVASVVSSLVDGPFHLLGHSLGGNVCLTASSDPSFNPSRLILVDAAGVLHWEAFTGSQLSSRTRPLAEINESAAALLGGLGKMLLETSTALAPGNNSLGRGVNLTKNRQGQAALELIFHNLAPRFAAVNMPTLLLWGTEDTVAPLRVAHLLQNKLPQAELQTFPGAGHTPMADVPEPFTQSVMRYLDGPPAQLAKEVTLRHAQNDLVRHCSDDEPLVLSGSYDTVRLQNCQQVQFRDSHMKRLVLDGSKVELIATSVSSGVVLRKTALRATGGRFSGDIALYLEDSEADLAGVNISATSYGIATKDGARLVVSASILNSPHHRGAVHQQIDLEAGEGL